MRSRFHQLEQELSSLRQQLQAHKVLLDSLGGAVITIGKDGRVVEWNRTAELLVGLRKEQVEGLQIDEDTTGSGVLGSLLGLLQRVNQGYEPPPFWIEATLPDGEVAELLVKVCPSAHLYAHDTRRISVQPVRI